MMRAPRTLLGLLAMLACEAPTPKPEAIAPGPDCAALLSAAARARACDPRLEPLMAELQASPDELRCRGAARLLLSPPPRALGRVVSVYERPPAPAAAPLTEAERGALAGLLLPGAVTLSPGLAPGPGVPGTTATLGGFVLPRDATGRLHGTRAPGQHLLAVRHAGFETRSCVTLRSCEPVHLRAEGAALAPHPALRPGPCEHADGD